MDVEADAQRQLAIPDDFTWIVVLFNLQIRTDVGAADGFSKLSAYTRDLGKRLGRFAAFCNFVHGRQLLDAVPQYLFACRI